VAVGAQGPPALRPNIILVLTDDEDVRIHAFLPKTRALLEDRGAVFPNAFVPYPLCCPSRASLLRGQYPHNTGVLGNQPPLGGFAVFVQRGLEASTVATWLRAVGCRTVFVGKYLNGYGDRRTDPTHIPPGWTEWYAGLGGRPYGNYDYALNENGRIVQYDHGPEDYLTDVIARKAVGGTSALLQRGGCLR
jgi:N-acetylglucosamine-6-sulfatase